MDPEVLKFISTYHITLFGKADIVQKYDSIFKTKEARAVWRKVKDTLSLNFMFGSTKEVLDLFEPDGNLERVAWRTSFWKNVPRVDGTFLKMLKEPKILFRLPYKAIVAVSDERLSMRLRVRGIPVILISSKTEARGVDRYEVIYGIRGDEVCGWLSDKEGFFEVTEQNVYSEQFVELLSGWSHTIGILMENKGLISQFDEGISAILDELQGALRIFESIQNQKCMSKKELDEVCGRMNVVVREELKMLTLSGESLITALSVRGVPREVEDIVRRVISESGYSRVLFESGFPIRVDEREMAKMLEVSRLSETTRFVTQLKQQAGVLQRVPSHIAKIESLLIYVDLVCGIFRSLAIDENQDRYVWPTYGEAIELVKVSNLLLERPEPITFSLSPETKCSILTGANSGGKTTLLEHLVQVVGLSQMGLPILGEVQVCSIESIYYFAKNKGSTSKGAFETMLTELSRIKGGKRVLILADEMEAVTEPGVAAHIIASTCTYFMSKQCYIVVATHLGEEIISELPVGARVDGIAATGLDSDMNLIVCHNPVMGKLANSTPELIVERLASLRKSEYFVSLRDALRLKKKDMNRGVMRQ